MNVSKGFILKTIYSLFITTSLLFILHMIQPGALAIPFNPMVTGCIVLSGIISLVTSMIFEERISKFYYLEIVLGPMIFCQFLWLIMYYYAPSYQQPFWNMILPISWIITMFFFYGRRKYVLSHPEIYKCKLHSQYECCRDRECILERMDKKS